MNNEKNIDKIKKIFKSAGLILLLIYGSAILFAIFNIDYSSPNKYIYMFIFNIILLGIFAFIYRKILIKDAKDFFKNFGYNMETSFKYWIIGFGIMLVSNLVITFILKKPIAGNESQVRILADNAPLFMIFDVILFAPFTEELLFRKSIKDIIQNKWIFVILSGLTFGFLHIAGYITTASDLIYLIPYGSLGVVFGLLYYKTDNIFSTITIHAIHNGIAILIYFIGVSL